MLAGVLALVVGGTCLYAKRNVLDSQHLAKTVVASLNHADVRDLVSRQTTNALVHRIPALASSRREVEKTTGKVIESQPFKSILSQAVVLAEQNLVDHGVDNSVVRLRKVGAVVRKQLAAVDPSLAASIPDNLDARIASLGNVPALTNAVQALHTVGFLGSVLPPVAVLLLLASIFVAPDRRAAAGRLGVTLIVVGALCVALSYVGRAMALGAVPSGLDRDAAGSVWDEVIGPFRTWLIVAAAAGLALVVITVALGRRGAAPRA
ncbi:MAG: hypothetical protein QOJ01_213 [Solirubrobacterales bacterium]|jgi:hypothetical protein|nr:hypothetical protein [Solirubrobacterales bacterium]